MKNNLMVDLLSVWKYGLYEALEIVEDEIDFSKISKEKLINLCLENIQYNYENNFIELEPTDYKTELLDMAEDYNMIKWEE